jgi:hypothetical protein
MSSIIISSAIVVSTTDSSVVLESLPQAASAKLETSANAINFFIISP